MTDIFAVRIHDGTNLDPSAELAPGSVGGLTFDLGEILAALGASARRMVWICSDLDCFGGRADELASAAEAGEPIPGRMLVEIAHTLTQVIDGQFVGREQTHLGHSVDIRAIDSSWWEVRATDRNVTDAIRASFRAVIDFDAHAA
jgi:hypothetical protein